MMRFTFKTMIFKKIGVELKWHVSERAEDSQNVKGESERINDDSKRDEFDPLPFRPAPTS